jgi:hypothetical protein
MSAETSLSHIAILVPSLHKAAAKVLALGFTSEPDQEHEFEGTREFYVQKKLNASLLLVQAINPGPYQRTLDKRGPGLHHLAIDVENVNLFVRIALSSGWTLHPHSEESLVKNKTAYLYSKGFPGLIEIHEVQKISARANFVSQLHLPIDFKSCGNLKVLSLDRFITNSEIPKVTMGKKTVELSEFI